MKPSILTRFAASVFGAVAAIVATLVHLVYQIARAVFNLPLVLIQNAASGAEFWRKRLGPRESNAQINARMLADPNMQDAEFIIVADTGKNGDEDRKLPFPKGFLEDVGLHNGQRVGQDRATDVAKQYLTLLKLQEIVKAIVGKVEGDNDLTKPTGRITSDGGCP